MNRRSQAHDHHVTNSQQHLLTQQARPQHTTADLARRPPNQEGNGSQSDQQALNSSHGSRPLRVAHITDLHWLSRKPPSLRELLGKRLIGYANLYLFNRKSHFNDQIRSDILRHVDALRPDVVLCSGDLSSTALRDEFEQAYEQLKPLMDKYPFFVIPGNHDVYTQDTAQTMPIYDRFASYMRTKESLSHSAQENSTVANHELHEKYPSIGFFRHKNLCVVGLNPCQPTVIGSNGSFKQQQLEELRTLLSSYDDITKITADSPSPSSQSQPQSETPPFIVLATHYPLVDRHGDDYQAVHKHHGVSNNKELLSILNDSPVKPGLVLHGHDHLGYASGLLVKDYSHSARSDGAASSTSVSGSESQRDEQIPTRTTSIDNLKDRIMRLYTPIYTPKQLETLSRSLDHQQHEKEKPSQNIPQHNFFAHYFHCSPPLDVQKCLSQSSGIAEQKNTVSLSPSEVSKHIDSSTGIGFHSSENPHTPFTVIPIHNPGSAGLSRLPPRNQKDWPKLAGFNLYTIYPSTTMTAAGVGVPSTISRLSSASDSDDDRVHVHGYTPSNHYRFEQEHYVHNGTEVVLNDIPYTYPLF